MKTISLLAATIASSLLVAAPSMAQPSVQFGIGPDGRPQIGVGDPERDRYERRERSRDRREAERARAYEEGRRDAARSRRDGDDCRTVTIRENDDWGRTVTRRVRRCN